MLLVGHNRLLLLLGSHSGVDAWSPQGLALFSFIVALNTFGSKILHALTRTFCFFSFLVECLVELMHHDLEVLNVFNIELGHVLLELSLFIINLVLQLNNFLCKSQLRSNGSMERDAEANRELKIIKTEI